MGMVTVKETVKWPLEAASPSLPLESQTSPPSRALPKLPGRPAEAFPAVKTISHTHLVAKTTLDISAII